MCIVSDSTMNYFEFLSSVHPISIQEYRKIEERFRSVSYKRGENIVVPDQIQSSLLLVKSGVQMSFTETQKALHVMAFTYYPSLCAIPESFLPQKPSRHFLTCLTASEFFSISFSALQNLFDDSQNIERLFRKMTESVLVGVLERHTEIKSLSMEVRYRKFCERSPHLLQLVPHKYIASYLNMDATNFSKLFNSIKL